MHNFKKLAVILAMKNSKKDTKEVYDKYILGVYSGVKITLYIPNKSYKKPDKENKYFLESYYLKKQHQYKENVRDMFNDYISSLAGVKVSAAKRLEGLIETFSLKILAIVTKLNVITTDQITINTSLLDAIKAFFEFQEEQFKKGEIDTLTSYRARTVKLNEFFNQETKKHLCLRDLNKDVWEDFRNYFLKQKIAKSSVNQYVVYVNQMYNWLILKEIQIFNHTKQLKRLDTSKQKPKFKAINDDLFNELYKTLEKEKNNFTRLYLANLLVYENTLRPQQVCDLQLKNIDLTKSIISRIYNAKNKSHRDIVISDKAKELIEIIIQNTLDKGIILEPEMYIIGGHNMLKTGIPHTPKELRSTFNLFKKQHPQFSTIKIYEQKKTSITNQFNDSTQTIDGIKQRAGHQKIETTQIYNQDKDITTPFTLNIKD